jgi:Domain of Unknown Function (DUF928)
MYTSIGMALVLELAIAFNLTAAIAPSPATAPHDNKSHLALQQAGKQSLPPPPPTNPGSSAAGGRRAPSACPDDQVAVTPSPLLTALSPANQPGFTLAPRPTFLVYVPRTNAETAEFSLRTRMGQGIYRTTIALTTTPNIISITLPDEAVPLEVDKPYIWSFAVVCNPGDRLLDQFVTGTVQRTELDQTRLRQVEQAPLRQRIALYQENRIWYDALALLFELNHSQPNVPEIDAAWSSLLQSGEVDTRITIRPSAQDNW